MFSTQSKPPLVAYLLTDPLEMMLFAFYANYPTTNYMEIPGPTMIDISYKSFVSLDTEARPCVEEILAPDTFACVNQLVESNILEKNFTCVPPFLESILPLFKGKICNDEKLNEQIFFLAYKFAKLDTLHYNCPISCTSNYYQLLGLPVTASKDSNRTNIHVRIANGIEEITTENYIHSPLSILTSTGGALGMFLGWSVYQNYLDWVDFMTKVLVKINVLKSNQHQ